MGGGGWSGEASLIIAQVRAVRQKQVCRKKRKKEKPHTHKHTKPSRRGVRTASLCHGQPTPPTPNLPTYQQQRNARRQMTANDVPAAAVRLVAVKDGDRGGGAPTHEHTLQAASSCSGEGTWQVQIARELASNPMPLPPPTTLPPSASDGLIYLSPPPPHPTLPLKPDIFVSGPRKLTSDHVSRTTRSGTQTAP